MNKDLGTYHVRVTVIGGDGFIMAWPTNARYTDGKNDISPLTASRIGCVFSNESELLDNVRFAFTDGNYSCDCNLKNFLADAKQQDRGDTDCGNDVVIQSIVVIRPDGSECTVLDNT